MQRAISLGVVIIAALAVVGVAAYFFNPASEPVSSGPMGKLSVETDTAIRNMVKEFGTHLKNVSLLATSTSAQFQTEYSAYISAELLSEWQANPSLALGRATSSPWPDRIEVVSVSPTGNSTYTVEGNVIEITSADKPLEPAAVYPITLTVVENPTGTWRITAVTKGAYSEIPQRTTITGVWECLPHKGDGPHTMECAFGIKEDRTGKHYAVSTELMSTYPVDYATGAHVRVSGVMVPKTQLNSNAWDTYDIVGIIGATTIEKL